MASAETLEWTAVDVPSLAPRERPIDLNEPEIRCLALNIYHEARGEEIEGKLAVAEVTLNRVAHPRNYGSTICEVVYKPNQFSWTLGDRTIREEKPWKESLLLAKAIVEGEVDLPGTGALYFHEHRTKPYWIHRKLWVGRIGNHTFYK